MPRSGRLRRFIKNYKESSRAHRLSFIPPFFILFVELILLVHALEIDHPDIIVVELTAILLFISVVEIILVSREMHEKYQKSNFDKILTIRLDDFITKTNKNNVKKIVKEFIHKYPKYRKNRSEIYHTVCQIMETHKEEKIEEDIEEKLRKFVDKRKKENVDDIVEKFVKKYPKYKRNRSEVYEITCQIKGI
jgi:hypothetical protein